MLSVRVLTIIALSAFGISEHCRATEQQKKQRVRARKENTKDPKKIIITITGDDGTEISKAIFSKNTDKAGIEGLSSLRFNWSKGVNTVTAYYKDDPKRGFGMEVPEAEAPKGSEIVIGEESLRGQKNINTLSIVRPDGTRWPAQKPEISEYTKATLEAEIKILIRGTNWVIISGDNHLTQKIAKNVNESVALGRVMTLPNEVFGAVWCNANYGSCKLPISTKLPTRIYAFSDDNTMQRSTISVEDVIQYGAVITIDATGKAEIVKPLGRI